MRASHSTSITALAGLTASAVLFTARSEGNPPPEFSVSPYFRLSARGQLDKVDADVRAQRMGVDGSATWLLPPSWRFTLEAGLEHDHFRLFNFERVIPGAAEPVRDAFRFKLAPTVGYVLNQHWSLVGSGSLEWSGDPDAEIGKSIIGGGFLGARRQFNDHFSLTFGALASTRLADTPRYLPMVGVDWQISRRWRLFTQGPGGQLNFAIRTEGRPLTAFAHLAYESREFRLAPDGSVPGGVLRDQSIPASLGLEWHATQAALVRFEVGSVMSGSIRIRNNQDQTVADRDLKSGSFVRLGLNLAFGGVPNPSGGTSASGAGAGSPEEAPRLSGSVFSAWEENDSVTGTDANYTQGIQFSYLAPEVAWGSMPSSLAWFGENLPALGYQVERARFTVATGQLMFTPIDIHTVAFQGQDRPYAGWMYVAPAVQRRGQTPSGNAVLEELRIGLGWIGPGSLTGEAQNFIHRNFAIGLAEGWTHQLHNEPTGDVTLARAWRHTLAGDRDGGSVEIVSHGAFTGGTPITQATAGGLIRIGVNLPDDFGQPTIQSTLPITAGVPRNLGFHVFAGIEGRATAYNSFVDGNLWRSSHSVGGVPFGYQSRVGFAVSWHSLDLGYTHARQSPDFKQQTGGNHDYGSVWLNWRI